MEPSRAKVVSSPMVTANWRLQSSGQNPAMASPAASTSATASEVLEAAAASSGDCSWVSAVHQGAAAVALVATQAQAEYTLRTTAAPPTTTPLAWAALQPAWHGEKKVVRPSPEQVGWNEESGGSHQ